MTVPMNPFSWRMASPRALAIIGALVLLRAAVYVYLGVNLILDDWALVDGDPPPPRPVAWLVDTLLYRGIGPHPLFLFVVITVLNLVAAWLVYLVGIRFVRSRTAFLVTALWVLAANHNTMTVWTATAPTVIAVILVLMGILLLTTGRWILAAVCLALSVLAYELTVPLCFVAAVVVPSSTPLGWKRRVLTMVPTALATWWTLGHPVYNSLAVPTPDIPLLWRAHFSDGLLGTASGPTRLVYALGAGAVAGLICSVIGWLAGLRDREDGPWLALCGFAVMILGSAGWLRIGLFSQSVGLFDRLLAFSSIGSVMIIVGVAQLVWRKNRPFAAIGAVGLCLVMGMGQYVSLRSWAAAGADAPAVLNFADAIRPPGGGPVYMAVGPLPRSHGGVSTSQADYDMMSIAYRLRFGDDAGAVRVVATVEEFAPEHPGEMFIDWKWIDSVSIFDEGFGYLAAVTVPGPEQATVYGWVQDGAPDSPPVEVEILVDGRPVARTLADVPRPDLALGRPNPNHAFEKPVAMPAGRHNICARTVDHGQVSLGCETADIYAPPPTA